MELCRYNHIPLFKQLRLQIQMQPSWLTDESWGYNRTCMMVMNIVSTEPKPQTQREPISLAMVMIAVGRVLMPLRSGAFGIHINRDKAIAVGMARIVIAILRIYITSHSNHPNFLGMGLLFHTLNIFIVALYQEIRTVLLNAMIIRIS